MATNYPSGIDSLTNPSAGDALTSPSHSAQHANANDAIEAIETELGTTPSGSETTVAARLTAIESGARMGTGSIGATALADNAVDTAAIQDGAVTPAKLATTGRFTFPTGAANGYGFTSGAVHLSGTGTPEGVITAAPGSTWLQIGDAITVSGNLSWRKATGTGNAGWIAEGALADTGWRDISGDLQNSWTVAAASSFRIRRIGNVVQLRAHVSGGTLDATIYSIPQAFRPTYTQYFLCADYSSGAVIGGGYYSSSLVRTGNNAAAYPDLTYFTDQAWPTSLPGS